jgi:kynureninase
VEEGNFYCDYAMRYDLIRMGMGSLYLSFTDVYRAFESI